MVAHASWPYRVHPAVDDELRHELAHYHDINPRLADQLFELTEEALRAICSHPLAQGTYLHGTRKRNLPRFPLRIVFRVRRQTVEVIALAHTSRRPGSGCWSRMR